MGEKPAKESGEFTERPDNIKNVCVKVKKKPPVAEDGLSIYVLRAGDGLNFCYSGITPRMTPIINMQTLIAQ